MIGEKFFDENNFAGEKIIPIFATALKRKRHTKIYCGVEQLVARWAHNPKVVGSNPSPATKRKGKFYRAFPFLISSHHGSFLHLRTLFPGF